MIKWILWKLFRRPPMSYYEADNELLGLGEVMRICERLFGWDPRYDPRLEKTRRRSDELRKIKEATRYPKRTSL